MKTDENKTSYMKIKNIFFPSATAAGCFLRNNNKHAKFNGDTNF